MRPWYAFYEGGVANILQSALDRLRACFVGVPASEGTWSSSLLSHPRVEFFRFFFFLTLRLVLTLYVEYCDIVISFIHYVQYAFL